jgi:hypothetical protein
VPAELHRSHPHPAGRGVHQQPLAGLETSKGYETVVGRQEDHWHARGLGERPARGHPGEHPMVRDRNGAEGPSEQAHDPVASAQLRHVGSDLEHDAGALAP